jgi:hypothetical protein
LYPESAILRIYFSVSFDRTVIGCIYLFSIKLSRK